MTDDLSPTAKRLREEHEQRKFNSKKKEAHTRTGRVWNDFGIVMKFVSQVVAASAWLWWNFGNPFLNKVTVPFAKWGFWWYLDLWNGFTRVKDEYGVERTSIKRGATMVAGTLLSLFIAFHTFLTVLDTGLYMATRRVDEVVWLSLAQEIDGHAGTFSVQGCEITPTNEKGLSNCATADALYFRVYNSTFNNMWSIVHGWNHGRPFDLFFPDQVVAPIGADWAKCVVTSYSVRVRLLMFIGDIYPVMLSASCERQTGG